MAIPNPSELKQRARTSLRRRLGDAEEADRRRWSEETCAFLLDWIRELKAPRPRMIGVYSALGTELDLTTLLEQSPDRALAFPLVVGESLHFYRIPALHELVKGAFEILEPDPAKHERVEAEALDLCLCPGLGFSPDGVRLGRGKAYYDSILPRLRPGVFRVGVGFELQIERSLPAEPHDIPMTHLVTEKGVRPIQAAST